ncbi:long-chain fatty acid--CoA ligase [Maricurvus nonylphenolicus]|uniref:AMP-binding protein n=1 Tax=Maricurvus nonylphenolicus TaxID=1008307 RepID=UPI0036F3AC56
MADTTELFSQQKLVELNTEGYSNLVDVFEESCKKYPSRVAFSCMGKDLTFSELERMSRNFSAYLRSEGGLEKGDHIAVQLPNISQYPIVAWGALRAGLVLVNTNPLYTERELVHQFQDSGAKALVALVELLPSIESAIRQTNVKTVIVTQFEGFSQAEVLPDTALANVLGLSALLESTPDRIAPANEATMDDIALLQYTGGTTGPAKGAVLTHGNIFAGFAIALREHEKYIEGDGESEVFISPMPLYHVYGFTSSIVGTCLGGVVSVLIPNPRDIDAMVQTMKSYRFTGMAGVNTLFSALLEHPEFDQIDFSALRGTISGGAALVTSIADEWRERTGSDIFEGYGLSETAASTSCNSPDERKLGTVGKPGFGTEVKVVDVNGKTLESGEEGELLIRGPQVLKGYWQRPEATAEAFDAEGWFRTGDVAVIHEDGYISIVDRIKDMILVSGFNVYPNEIEDVVSSHPDVFECAAVGVADDRTAEAVKLFVVKTNEALTEKNVRDFCRQELAAYKVPKYVVFKTELPKSAVGKILRRELRD